jgi:protein-L-isoaspartate(D-aspartate) O-methyltransferase
VSGALAMPADDLPSDRRRRERMVHQLADDEVSAAVAAAMRALPRHWFMPQDLIGRAYDDCALPIGSGQTISQPRLIARMLTCLALRPGQRVLDVGAGSGYTAALIAALVAPGGTVLALERQQPLLARAAPLLARVAPAVALALADALAGLPGEAPFDAIHVACACPEVPATLLAALAPGGRMVVPVGEQGGWQQLLLLTRGADGATTTEELGEVTFVPALPGLAG